MASQLLRSGTSPSLNYGEAMSAESRSDFIHKLKIALKELRETKNNILIIQKANLSTNKELMMFILKECSELIAILVKSTETAQKNKLDTDAQLRGRDRPVEILGRYGHTLRARHTLCDHGFHLGPAHRHQGKLGRHKERVQKNQQRYQKHHCQHGQQHGKRSMLVKLFDSLKLVVAMAKAIIRLPSARLCLKSCWRKCACRQSAP